MEERLHAQTAFVGHLENIFKDGTPNFCYSKEVLWTFEWIMETVLFPNI